MTEKKKISILITGLFSVLLGLAVIPSCGESLSDGLAPGNNYDDSYTPNCQACHNGGYKDTAAPDQGAHLLHTAATRIHEGFDCETCHVVPESPYDEGHFDDTPDAEVVLYGLSGDQAYYDNKSCFSIYCHGDGHSPSGRISWNEVSKESLGCSSCHADETTPESLSPIVFAHIDSTDFVNPEDNERLSCNGCHDEEINANKSFKDAGLHINGRFDVSIVNGGNWNKYLKSCSHDCHRSGRWTGRFHPFSFANPDEHGMAFYQEGDCTFCHGDDYEGKVVAVSCDDCHNGVAPD